MTSYQLDCLADQFLSLGKNNPVAVSGLQLIAEVRRLSTPAAEVESRARKDERERLARMIDHKPTHWWGTSMVVAAVRNGDRCHPECAGCELDGPPK